jgi:hypothetical protein
MFNREIQVRVVKAKKQEKQPPAEADISLEGKVAIIGYYTEKGIRKVGQAVIGYVVVDTLRQILIAKALKR